MRKPLLLLAGMLCLSLAHAAPLTLDGQLDSLENVPRVQLEALDFEALRAEDAQREAQPGVAPRFAVPHPVSLSNDADGRWEEGPGDTLVWRLRIHAPKASSINLGFSRYQLPAGAELHLFSEDGKRRIRPFTAEDNKPHGQLWTPILEGDSMVLELQVPAALRGDAFVEVGSINYGYRGLNERSGSCNVDVACPEGEDWQDQIQSVARITVGGSSLCTGAMVNNVIGDETPYFLTAHHCGLGPGNASTLVTYWNYENSTCRPPGSPGAGGSGDGSLSQFISGSTFRAGNSATDFTLAELDAQPDPEWEVAYVGWDARDQATDWAVAVHHPRGDEKRISFENDPTTITALGSATPDPGGTHIRVADWDLGTTEDGSSGSPLFSPEGRVVGQLHGGYAACGNNLADWYGRIAVSWDGSSSSNRLRDWLDPSDTGTLFIDALGTDGFTLEPESDNFSQCSFDDLDIAIDVEPVSNFSDPVNLSVDGLPAGVTADFSVNPVTPPGTTQLELGELAEGGTGTFTFTVEGESGDFDDSATISITLFDDAPGIAEILAPTDGSVGVGSTPTIEWSQAGQAAEYALEIATDDAFSSVVYSATVGSTTHQVADALDGNTEYFVRVQAINDCGTGDWSETSSFTTLGEPGDCPVGTDETSLLFEDFSEGAIPAGWSTDGSSGAATWVASTDQSHTGDYAVFAENIDSVSDQRLATPSVNLPADASNLFLNFQNWQHVESSGSGCWDGGLLEISTDGGASWAQVMDEDILVREYDGPISSEYSNPLGDMPGWCGEPRDEWERYTVDLSGWAGQEVSFRFRFGTDSSISRVGWYVDEVNVLACEASAPLQPEIFEDRFEAATD